MTKSILKAAFLTAMIIGAQGATANSQQIAKCEEVKNDLKQLTAQLKQINQVVRSSSNGQQPSQLSARSALIWREATSDRNFLMACCSADKSSLNSNCEY